MACCATRKRGNHGTPAAIAAGLLVLTLTGGCTGEGAGPAATRWQPAGTDVVVATVAPQSGAATLARLRPGLAAAPRDAGLAARFVRVALETYAGNGDPRLLGYATGVLAPWQDDPAPPRDLWLLRGRLLQTMHRFAAAAADLEGLLRADPDHAEALLLAADARRRGGDVAAARRHCLRLGVAGHHGLAALCAADIRLSLGDAEAALDAASAALGRAGGALAPAAVVAWGQALCAEAAAAAGRHDEAQAAWLAALAATPQPSLATHVGYADLLLERGEPREALRRLLLLPPADAVLLRRAMAARQSGDGRFAAFRDALRERYAEPAGDAGPELHLRERALYALHVTGDSGTALELARRNWTLQKGREDAELLLQAAAAAGATADAEAVRAWRAAASTAT